MDRLVSSLLFCRSYTPKMWKNVLSGPIFEICVDGTTFAPNPDGPSGRGWTTRPNNARVEQGGTECFEPQVVLKIGFDLGQPGMPFHRIR